MSPERLDRETNGSIHGSQWVPYACGLATACAACVLLGGAFLIGRWTTDSDTRTAGGGLQNFPVELLQASATHGGTNMAVCTGRIDEESDGFFALDYTTGDLKCWVYNPRFKAFTGLFATNVVQFLGSPGKNPEYLLINGRVDPPAANSTTRSAGSVIYVVDVKMGQFVAFEIPWDRSLRNTGAQQANAMIPVGGDMIRPAMAGGGARKPPPPPNANANPGNPNPNDPNAPPANPNN